MRTSLKHAALPLALLTLAACGNDAAQEAPPPPDPELREEQTLPQPAPEAAPAPADLPDVTDGTIPEPFRGQWALVAGDCEPGAADAKGLMTVTADMLTFYESRAAVEGLSATAPGELMADLAFTGEGQEWQRETTLRLEDAGKTLIRAEEDMEPLAYQRCADIALPE